MAVYDGLIGLEITIYAFKKLFSSLFSLNMNGMSKLNYKSKLIPYNISNYKNRITKETSLSI